MMRLAAIVAAFALLASHAKAQSVDVPSYTRKFGKEDRVGLYTDKALTLLGNNVSIQQQIIDNTLFMDCGSQQRPATGFVLDLPDLHDKTCEGRIAVTAAHNVKMALDNNRTCKVSGPVSAKITQSQMMISPEFKNTGLVDDQAYDFALLLLPESGSANGYSRCPVVDIDTTYCSAGKPLTVAQSIGSHTGTMGLSPRCCSIETQHPDLLTTTCKGYYKSSGAPVLKIREQGACVEGVFNAYNGKDYGFQSFAASLHSESFRKTTEVFITQHCGAE